MRIAVAGGTGVVGTYVVEAARAAGHDVVALSRRTGVDVRTGHGLHDALAGVDVIVDTLNGGLSKGKATAFFVDATAQLQRQGAAQGVAHLVVLSIVGIDKVPGYGYYQAKLAHEAAARQGPLPVTVVRATQFLEFPAQVLSRSRLGPVAVMPSMRSQPVAARALGRQLVDITTDPGRHDRYDVGGPEEINLVDLARRTLARRGRHVAVVPLHVPGAMGRAIRAGAILPTHGALLVGPTPEEWLAGPDPASAPG